MIKLNVVTTPKILIIGHGRHGKDTFADYLCQSANLIFTSSSYFFAEYMFWQLGGFLTYPTVETCFEDRVNKREYWRDQMSLYNQENPAQLAKDILEVSDVYVGMRTQREFNAAKSLFHYIFYVDARPRVEYVDPTFEIEYDPQTMIRIDNGGTEEELKQTAKLVADFLAGSVNIVKVVKNE